jgi:hypothetical protein
MASQETLELACLLVVLEARAAGDVCCLLVGPQTIDPYSYGYVRSHTIFENMRPSPQNCQLSLLPCILHSQQNV